MIYLEFKETIRTEINRKDLANSAWDLLESYLNTKTDTT
jgi:hypothetical protein